MESFLGDVTEQYPDLALFETTEGLRMPDENAHVWMSVSRYRGQVNFIAERLCEISPEHAQELQANARAYDSKLAELEAQQEEILENHIFSRRVCICCRRLQSGDGIFH